MATEQAGGGRAVRRAPPGWSWRWGGGAQQPGGQQSSAQRKPHRRGTWRSLLGNPTERALDE
eukprot:1570506-Prymnesium_polylepis.1